MVDIETVSVFELFSGVLSFKKNIYLIMRIVADEKISFLKGVFEPYAKVEYYPGSAINPDVVKTADALIVRTRTKVNEFLLKNSSVKVVVSATIGTDHVDTAWLEDNGIQWANAPGCNSSSVMQYIASVFASLEMDYYPLRGKTLGVVGVGNVGQKVARVGEAFGMKVVLNDPPRKEKEEDFAGVDLNVLLQMSDVVSFHVPLNIEGEYPTYHLLNDTTLLMMKRGCVVINTSRGEVVEERVLMKGLSSGIIERGILDVWENEPDISIELFERLMIGTPHIAGYSIDGKANGTAAAVNFVSQQFGFGLDGWFPEKLAQFDDMSLTIKGEDDALSLNQMFAQTILRSYDVKVEFERLASDTANFEKLRGNYPLRREFSAWSVNVKPANQKLEQALSLIGIRL
jgi:erythronate-4-phosphate dehydrogenase